MELYAYIDICMRELVKENVRNNHTQRKRFSQNRKVVRNSTGDERCDGSVTQREG